ncbi:general secretion pathway protein GspB [Alteromonas sp. BMJM2]|uniref:general secretion pathway protein GspB n=1 Tax=Alteromonas sp. BMJM2 TaxID=2954241 RepID=UPI0022B5796C|nr:general secretion pathway protein GspB [Alteromonas sp. BMJM2]
MSSIVAIENLQPGMVIVQITKQNGPVKIRKSGLVSSDAMVQGLSEMGVQELEIDPEQTVEVAAPTPTSAHHRTQTQALLRGQHDTSARFDKSLNDQFNRSLFLPTVEGLPSSFSLYAKQAFVFAVVIMGGLALGFTAATKNNWWPALASSISTDTSASAGNIDTASNTPSNTSADAALNESGTSGEQASSTNTGNNLTPAQQTSQRQPAQQPSQQPSQQSAQQQYVGNTQNVMNNNVSQPSNNQTASNGFVDNARNTGPGTNFEGANSGSAYSETGRADNQESTAQGSTGQNITGEQGSTDEYEGKVLNEASNANNIEVSPELMARFNAAVEALDDKSPSSAREPETKVTVRDDTLRVDQLPVRLLTRLPTMNFSAHMYASQPRDRWVRVNGRQLSEGDWIADKVQIVNIEAQRVVLAFEDEIFTMAALTDW